MKHSFLSYGETRLYHDRFNFSGMPHDFQAFPAGGSLLRRTTWKWVTGCGLAAVLAGWLSRAQWSSQAFDWGFAARAAPQRRWPWWPKSSAQPRLGADFWR